MRDAERSSEVYDLFQRGRALLERGDFAAAAVPLTRARVLEPDKASIREALGRALFHSQRYREAAEEFRVLAAASPTDDYAHFCLGRSLQQLGRHREAMRGPLSAIAACLRLRAHASTACTAIGRGGIHNPPGTPFC